MSGQITGDRIQIHYETTHGEWAALYVDGELVRVGDNYLAEEKAFELLGVTIVQDSAFMRGQNQAAGVAQTLDEVQAYRDQRESDLAEADRLQAEAAALIERAQQLRGSK